MNFFSFEFLASFTAFFLIYWLCQKKPRLQNILLITASYLFVFLFQEASRMCWPDIPCLFIC